MDPVEAAWAAGLFEGEGSIGRIAKQARAKEYATLSLQMTCEDVVRRFHGVVVAGGVRARPPRQEGWKDSWIWSTSQAREVERILRAFGPHLGVKKSLEAAGALRLCAAVAAPMGERTHCVNGHEFTPENTRFIQRGERRERQCRRCEAASKQRRRAVG